jgi:mediator of RNA polymerase II transcription subunit 25
VTDIPENVDLKWIATILVAFQNDMRALKNDVRILKDDVRGIKDDLMVTQGALRRLELKQDIVLEEVRALYPQINQLRERVDTLERR